MLYYYIFIVFVALLCYSMLLFIKKKMPGISARMCLFVVLWALFLSFFLPGIIGILTPGASLLLLFILFLLGGFLIIDRVSVSNSQREKILSQRNKGEKAFVLDDTNTVTYSPSSLAGEVSHKLSVDDSKLELTLLLEPDTAEDMMNVVETEAVAARDVAEEAARIEAEEAARQEAEEAARQEAEEAARQEAEEAAALLNKYLESDQIESEEGVFLLPQQELSYNELFESAFEARKECNYELAVDNLRRSLDGTTDIFLKGLIYTELVFLYKEMGKYLEAAGMIQGFVSENGAMLAPALVRQFTSLVNYLQTIDQLLKKAEQSEIPYSQVPRLIKLRAEKLLKE